MGCDIRVHIEVKLEADGPWLHYSTPHVKRDYRLFARMANVRNEFEIKPISDPRGLPIDISTITRIEAEISQYNWGFSWLSGGEADRVVAWYNRLTGAYFPQVFGYILGNEIRCPQLDVEDCPYVDSRIVFWFDG